MMGILELKSLSVTIDNLCICEDLSLQLEASQVLGVLGRNGVGKTTLLHTIMGFHPADKGEITLLGSAIEKYPHRVLAQKLGILLQQNINTMPATVLETAILGLHPHSDNLLWDTQDEIDATRKVLGLVGLEKLEHRQISTLSGGERQRLSLALLLTQAPQLYLLDEPNNHLDIDYQIKTMKLLKDMLRVKPSAMILTTHDINLAVRFCDKILLMLGNGKYSYGSVTDVISEESLSLAFNCQFLKAVARGETFYMPA